MIQLAAWWRARTDREKLLLRSVGVLVFVLVLPAWIYVSAASFREDASRELLRAQRVSEQIARLREFARNRGAVTIAADGSLRERALSAAGEVQLVVAQLEPSGPDRIRVIFQAADSNAVYRWVEALGRRGGAVTESVITRVGDTNQVNAEFEASEAS